MRRGAVIAAILAVQAACAVFFVYDILTSVLGLGGPIAWQVREFIEIGAAAGLILGLILGAVALRQALTRSARAESRLRAASAAFYEVMEARFAEWGLTPAEKDVALFAVKGLTTAEIAALRETSEGTVKAQSAAIYRKAGVSNRAQLLALFIDHLMEDLPPRGETRPSDAA